MIRNFRCHLHTIGNHYAKYEHLLMTDFSICELDRCLQGRTKVVMVGTMGQFFFKPEKNLEFFRLKNCPIDAYPGKLE